jgi:hypothetical protein
LDKGVIRRVYERRVRFALNDVRLATHFHLHRAEIAHRFHDMIAQLPAPYAALTLPTIVTTASILAQT